MCETVIQTRDPITGNYSVTSIDEDDLCDVTVLPPTPGSPAPVLCFNQDCDGECQNERTEVGDVVTDKCCCGGALRG